MIEQNLPLDEHTCAAFFALLSEIFSPALEISGYHNWDLILHRSQNQNYVFQQRKKKEYAYKHHVIRNKTTIHCLHPVLHMQEDAAKSDNLNKNWPTSNLKRSSVMMVPLSRWLPCSYSFSILRAGIFKHQRSN